MAVIINQTPKNREGGITQPVSPTNYPLFTTWTNNLSSIYNDYKYKIDISNENGIQTTFQTLAQSPNLFGDLSVTNYVDSVLKNVFQPKIDGVKNCPNQMGNYKMKITPYNNGSYQTSLATVSETFFMIKASYEGIMFELYDKELFVNHSVKRMTTETYATNKSLYGSFSSLYSYFEVDFNKIKYELVKKDGTQMFFFINNNYTKPTMASETSLGNTDDRIIEFPIGPKSLTETFDIILTEIIYPNGYSISFGTGTLVSLEINDGDKYRYATFKDDTQISYWYDIEVKNCNNYYTPMTINFLNDRGGYNTHTFYAKSEETITNKQSSFLKYPYERVGDNYYKTNYNRGQKVFKDDITQTVVADTDWISKQEVIELKELWTSTDVYIQYDGEIIPVIIKDIQAPIYNPKSKKLRKYVVQFTISDKKYKI